MSCVAPLSPLKIQLQAVSFWGQPGGLPPALERAILVPVQLEAVPPIPIQLDLLGSPDISTAIPTPKGLVPRSPQCPMPNDGSILFPDTF
jgi:hypothetical protein